MEPETSNIMKTNDQGMVVEENMEMPKFTIKTRKLLIYGIILLAMVGVLVGKYEGLIMAVGGFLTLLKGDED